MKNEHGRLTSAEMLQSAQQCVGHYSTYAQTAVGWPVQVEYEHRWTIPVIDILRDLGRSDLLDVGAGYGTLAVAAHLLGFEVTAVDWFLPPQEFPGIFWHRVDVEHPGALSSLLHGYSFDVITLTEVLEHFNWHPRHVFETLHACLRPGGVFIGTTPNPESWAKYEQPPVKTLSGMPYRHDTAVPIDQHTHFYSPEEITELLASVGFNRVVLRSIADNHHLLWEARCAN